MGVPPDFSPPERAGPYRLAEPLGRGGYGAVYRGVDDAGREAALKLHPRGGRALARFRQEYLLLSWLDHPAIPRALAFGEAPGGVAWLAMELAAGEPLSAAARRSGPPGAPERTARALALVASLLQALVYLHAQGVIHGDLKPGNVLASPGGAARLLDFGAAQIVRPGERYAPSPFVGTRHHAPLEQLVGRPLDARSDLFAAGVIAYQLLTDARPYSGETLEECLRERVERAPAPPAERIPGIPAEISALVMELLAASPADRPPSAAAALARLGAEPPPWLAPAGVPAALQRALAERAPAPPVRLREPGPLREDLARLGIPFVEGLLRAGPGLEGLGEAVQRLAAGLDADPPGVDRAWLADLDMAAPPAEPRRLLHAVTAVALAAQPAALLLAGEPGPLAAEALALLEQWILHYCAPVWILR